MAAPHKVRRRIGYFPQLLSADGALTGYENLLLSSRLYGLPRRERARRIEHALATTGLTEAAGHWCRRSSTGGDRMPHVAATASDQSMMERCIALSRTAGEQGEFPFACVIRSDERVVAKSVNRGRDQDIARHAEMVAISAAQRELGRIRLRTLYTNVEPCAMCSWVNEC